MKHPQGGRVKNLAVTRPPQRCWKGFELADEHLDGGIGHARTETLRPTVQQNRHALLAATEGVRTTLIGVAGANQVDVRAADAISESIKLALVAASVEVNIHRNGVVASLHYEYLQKSGV